MQASILWCRLDPEGHDACQLRATGGGWRLEGHALFLQDGEPCSLAYSVDCDARWRTRAARVDGFLGAQTLSYAIERLAGDRWMLNRTGQTEVVGLVGVDLGFTPATNLLAIRRLGLAVGAAAPAPAAYLAFPEVRLSRLEQTYRRLDEARYAYAAPVFGYDAVLTVSPAGFVLDYPGLWRSAAQEMRGK